jgi:hypothetical protein
MRPLQQRHYHRKPDVKVGIKEAEVNAIAAALDQG